MTLALAQRPTTVLVRYVSVANRQPIGLNLWYAVLGSRYPGVGLRTDTWAGAKWAVCAAWSPETCLVSHHAWALPQRCDSV